jgi:hypothetical protein
VEVEGLIDLADDVKRVIVFDEDDQRQQREDPGFSFEKFIKSILDEGWDLIEISAGKRFIMKFEHKKRR